MGFNRQTLPSLAGTRNLSKSSNDDKSVLSDTAELINCVEDLGDAAALRV